LAELLIKIEEVKIMTKVVYCNDLGFDCDGVVRSESEEELMAQVADHARNVHDVNVTDEMTDQVRNVIREEE
jgi:predicted small metal-binding protein